jgi:Reverse transcriptase (RNA-dependent DNA polymerase)
VAHTKFRSKVDLLDVYEQVHIHVEDVNKTAFTTISRTYVSHIMQQGDCNAPAMFQWLMMSIFRDVIGRFISDDIFIFSNTVEEHEQHLKGIFDRQKINFLYLKWTKCELYASCIDCLGHIIDDKGIHPDTDKLSCIRTWCTPCDYTDIQHFIGLVNYVGNFLPDVTSYTGLLLSMTENEAPFY